MKTKKNPDPTSNYPNIPDDEFDPREIPSLKSTDVSLSSADRTAIAAALLAASQAHFNDYRITIAAKKKPTYIVEHDEPVMRGVYESVWQAATTII